MKEEEELETVSLAQTMILINKNIIRLHWGSDEVKVDCGRGSMIGRLSSCCCVIDKEKPHTQQGARNMFLGEPSHRSNSVF